MRTDFRDNSFESNCEREAQKRAIAVELGHIDESVGRTKDCCKRIHDRYWPADHDLKKMFSVIGSRRGGEDALFFGTFNSLENASLAAREIEAEYASLPAGPVRCRVFSGVLNESAHLEDAHLDHAEMKALLSEFVAQANASQNTDTTAKMVYYAKKEAGQIHAQVEKTPEERASVAAGTAAKAAADRLERTPAWLK